jgi:two-component system, NarL family, nitrate/nitrite response regulator NarL
LISRARVVLADDHVPTRAGVRAALESEGFGVVGEAGTGRGAVELALAHRPDVCLLDVHMPDGAGIEAAAAIRQQLPDTAIVMLTVSEDDEDLFGALRAGAQGYLLKDTDPDRLGAALRGVLRGEAAIPRMLVARVVDDLRRRASPMRTCGIELTDRESEVLGMLHERRSTKEIAHRLNLSDVTVRRHISSLVRKLGVADREAAVQLLDEAGGRS